MKDRSNVEWHIGALLPRIKAGDYLDASVIYLDTLHEGPYEREFTQALIDVGWQGALILDDLTLTPGMAEFWKWVCSILPGKAFDMSEVGHWSGTGVVFFNASRIHFSGYRPRPIPK